MMMTVNLMMDDDDSDSLSVLQEIESEHASAPKREQLPNSPSEASEVNPSSLPAQPEQLSFVPESERPLFPPETGHPNFLRI